LIFQIRKEFSKMNHGGSRPGSGRKPSTIKGVTRRLPKDTAELILSEIKANQKWLDLANSKDEYIVLGVLRYLTDRAFGKAKQRIEAQGEGGGAIIFGLQRIGNNAERSEERAQLLRGKG
jgi:hypothetical protein